ncbi:MAG: hypothetical protein IAE78_27885 [Myxococcus sp.]|nr:hypothetical protein [Myxococcus sp.]
MDLKRRKSGWKQWTADEAREALKAWKASGRSRSAFARRAGVSAQRLSWWERRLGDWRDTGPAGLKLVPVVTTPLVGRDEVRGGALVTMRLPGGVELEFDVTHVAAEWVATVARAVAGGR